MGWGRVLQYRPLCAGGEGRGARESRMKSFSSSTPATSAYLVDPMAGGGTVAVPVAQALAAIAEPATTVELAQRLIATVGMLWPNVASADLFLPEGGSGQLIGVGGDAEGGTMLLSAVAAAHATQPGIRVIPITPTLVAPGADPAGGAGASMSAPVFTGREVEGFVIVQRHPGAPGFTEADLDALTALGRGIGQLLP